MGTRRIVQLSCETTALTTLPDALLDDDTISPLTKVAYWYLKRHGGLAHVDDASAWAHLDDLAAAGWITVPDSVDDTKPVQFTVHEVPAVER